METVEQPPAGPGATQPPGSVIRPSAPNGELAASNTAEPDLDLLLDWARDPDENTRLRYAAIGTVAAHILLILALLAMPQQEGYHPRRPERRPMQITKLIDPPTELTQKAPNRTAPSKELAVQSPTPTIPTPVPTPAPGAKSRKFTPPVPEKKPSITPSVIEPPKIEQAQSAVPQIPLPQLPPQIQPQERPPSESKPKLAFETPTAPPSGTNSRVLMPGNTVQEAVHDLARGGAKGLSGSDTFDLGNGSGLNIPPSPGRPRMDYELKSDPMGVDFRPYVLQVLAIVRRNWFTVYPDSAKLGTRGQVKLEFAVAKDGKVTKVVFSWQSGTTALDRAAVNAISMANPLPPLPSDFHGDRIVLAFTFSYNMGR